MKEAPCAPSLPTARSLTGRQIAYDYLSHLKE
jgi:hypothetical protein